MSEHHRGSGRSSSRHGQRRSSHAATEPPGLLLNGVDLGLAGTVVLVPFAMGGRQALGQLLLVVLSLWTAVCWAAYQLRQQRATWTWSRAELLLLAAITLLAVQMLSLPASWINTLSPRLGELLVGWKPPADGEISFGVWKHLSLTPYETRDGLVVFLAYALLFLVTVQRIRNVADAERLLRLVALTTAAMAVFALVQYATSNGKFFWIYDHPYTHTSADVKGAFTNRNHFADFMALGIGPLLWWLLDCLHQTKSSSTGFGGSGGGGSRAALPIVIALALVMFAGLLSLSRGGAVAIAVATLMSVFALYRAGSLSGRVLFGLVGLGVLLAGLIFAVGDQKVQSRLDDLVSGDVERMDQDSGRREIWNALAVAISEFPILGTGVGSHREVYPIYLDKVEDGFEYTHAENGYLQVALETGFVGLGLMLLGFGLCLLWCWRGLRTTGDQHIAPCLAGIFGSLMASLAHSCGDFVWYVPGCMVVLIVLAACACRLSQLARKAEGRAEPSMTVPWIGWAAAIPALAVLGFWMVQMKLPALAAEPHWHEYLKFVMSQQPDDELTADALREELTDLVNATKANPDDARLQLRMANAYLKLFNFMQTRGENAMSLGEIRDAVWNSEFASQEQLDEWLNRVIGRNRKYLEQALVHARQALKLCPVQGQAYLQLAELSFIEGTGRDMDAACLQQALAVRPFAPPVLFAAGQRALFAGEMEDAFEQWRAAFQRSPAYQQRIIEMLAGYISATEFLENIQPDWTGLLRLCQHYRRMQLDDDLRTAQQHFAVASVRRAKSSEGATAIEGWLNAHAAFNDLGRSDLARKCLEAAYKTDPNSLAVRRAFGAWLFARSEFAAAAEHLSWCAAREPDDHDLRRLAEAAVKESLRRDPAAAASEAEQPDETVLR